MRPLAFVSLVAATVIGCSDENPVGPSSNLTPSYSINSPPPAARDITVMSQNLYVGANVDLVIQALLTPDPDDDLDALLFAIETVGKTAFPARAEAIADEIARARPHAVGLQGVSEINIDLRPFGVVSQDFLALLQDALARRGLNYQVAASSDNIDVSLVSGLVRLADHDVLLVDADRVTVTAASGQTFAVNVGPVAPGISLIRGWVQARTTIDGQSYTFASAHTEANLAGAPPGDLEQIRLAQVGEMVAALASSERVVLMGDLNDAPGSPMYNLLTSSSSGYTDTWMAVYPGAAGLTCCHDADLSNGVADFDQRIDYIFTRGFARSDGKLSGQLDRFGEVPADRLAGPADRIWPSDHVGLLGAFRVTVP
jgi:Endonuclease/Exonuclease/phosphatase family